MSKILEHALLEFKATGWADENGKFKDEMQELMCTQVLELLTMFSNHGHSGTTAPYAVDMFKKLAMFEPLCPLTGEDWEWTELSYTDDIKYQNKRCGHVFKGADGQAYDIQGKVFWDWYTDKETGEKFKSYYTSRDSRVYVTFPYTPKVEYVEQPSE